MKAFTRRVGTLVAMVSLSWGCVKIDEQLGADYIATEQLYDIYVAEIPLEHIRMELADSLSGFSDSRITIGAVRDELFGVSTRSCALTLVPALDTLDFGKDPVFQRMHFSVAADTLSYPDEASAHLLQNIRVYELSEPIDFNKGRTNTDLPHGSTIISDGPVVYSGSDSLSFDFSREFGQRFLDELDWRTDLDTMPHYTAKFPGIYLETDIPAENGGRINTFKLSSVSYSSSYRGYMLNGNRVSLRINAEYDGVRRDTTFLFLWGEPELEDEASYVNAESSSAFPQYALNITGHETKALEGTAGQYIYVEGGGGLKPVISAEELRNLSLAEIRQHGDPAEVIISKASIVLPFDLPDSWYALNHQYPVILSPTLRLITDDAVAFAGLSDSSISTENQGDINRSTLCYSPDITHHLQQLIWAKADVDISNYDVWLLIMSKIQTETVSDTSANDYYSQLAYYSYLNSIYGGGYGGYGYGSYGYGSGYGSNYYNYYMMAAMASAYSSSGSTTSTSTILDRDCFFKALLNGPESASDRKPLLQITYALPRR